MLPPNARNGDFVEVINKEHTYFGMVGKIKQTLPTKATVDIYGKLVDIDQEDLKLRARVGTRRHDDLVEQLSAQEAKNLDEIGYDGLIDFAIDIKDWDWASDLVQRKKEHLANKMKRR